MSGDAVVFTSEPHGTRLQHGEDWTFLYQVPADVARTAYGAAIALAREVYEPRWRAVTGPTLSEAEFETLLHRIIFEILYIDAINARPPAVTRDDLAHPYARRWVRAASGLAHGQRTRAANQLAAQLLDIELSRYEWWLEQEDAMDAVR